MDPKLEQQLKELGPLLEGVGRTLVHIPYTYETLTDIRDMLNHAAETIQDVRDVTYTPGI